MSETSVSSRPATEGAEPRACVVLSRVLLGGIGLQLLGTAFIHPPLAVHQGFGAVLAALALADMGAAYRGGASLPTRRLAVALSVLFAVQLAAVALSERINALVYVHIGNAVLLLLVSLILVLHLGGEDEDGARE